MKKRLFEVLTREVDPITSLWICLVLATVIIGAKVLTDRAEDYVMDESEMYMPAL